MSLKRFLVQGRVGCGRVQLSSSRQRHSSTTPLLESTAGRRKASRRSSKQQSNSKRVALSNTHLDVSVSLQASKDNVMPFMAITAPQIQGREQNQIFSSSASYTHASSLFKNLRLLPSITYECYLLTFYEFPLIKIPRAKASSLPEMKSWLETMIYFLYSPRKKKIF